METVIYFQSSYCESNDAEVHGVQRWAQQAKWNVQVIPYAEAAASRLQSKGGCMKPPPIAKLIDFWHPIGAVPRYDRLSLVFQILKAPLSRKIKFGAWRPGLDRQMERSTLGC